MGRRTESTEFLKECIADALIQLMGKYPIDKIKVQEITDLAGVGRMTYFRYFNSKQEVLAFKASQLWLAHIEETPYPNEEPMYAQALYFFSFCYELRSMLSLFYRQGQISVFLDIFLKYSQPMEDEFYKNHYLRLYAAYGMLGVIMGWIQNDFKETPEELAHICTQYQ